APSWFTSLPSMSGRLTFGDISPRPDCPGECTTCRFWCAPLRALAPRYVPATLSGDRQLACRECTGSDSATGAQTGRPCAGGTLGGARAATAADRSPVPRPHLALPGRAAPSIQQCGGPHLAGHRIVLDRSGPVSDRESRGSGTGGELGCLPAFQHLVDESVLLGLFGGEDLVALDVLLHLLHIGPGVVGDGGLQPLPHPYRLIGVDLDVGGLREAAFHRGLVDQHTGVGQCQALARGTRRQKYRRGRGRLSEADRLDLRADVLHRVVDRRHRGERATG